MTDLLIPGDELLAELADAAACQDCAGGLGVHVELDSGEWSVVRVHDVPCAARGSRTP